MEVICQGCQTKLSIPDDRLPATGSVVAACPKCKAKIVIQAPGAQDESQGSGLYSESLLEGFEAGVSKALLLDDDPGRASQMEAVLDALGYRTSKPATLDEARGRLKFNHYDLVMLRQGYGLPQAGPEPGMSPFMADLNALPMTIRRKMFVVLVGPALHTGNRMEAFVASVNMVVAERDLADGSSLTKTLKTSLAENELFYKLLRDVLAGTGRA